MRQRQKKSNLGSLRKINSIFDRNKNVWTFRYFRTIKTLTPDTNEIVIAALLSICLLLAIWWVQSSQQLRRHECLKNSFVEINGNFFIFPVHQDSDVNKETKVFNSNAHQQLQVCRRSFWRKTHALSYEELWLSRYNSINIENNFQNCRSIGFPIEGIKSIMFQSSMPLYLKNFGTRPSRKNSTLLLERNIGMIIMNVQK